MRDGTANRENVEHETRTDRMLISNHFAYRGEGPERAGDFRDWDGLDVCLGRQGHRCNFPDELIAEFVDWLEGMGMDGFLGRPGNW